jgi:hypothetical protein
MKKWIIISLAVGLSLSASAQSNWTQQLGEEDQEALEALVLYPADVREAILIAGTQPEILVRMERVQAESQQNFEAALAGLEQADQEAIWEMTRYPGLLEAITREGQPNSAALQRIAPGYDDAVRPAILDQGQRNYNRLVQVQSALQQAENTYTELLKPYPQNVRDAYGRLVGMPDVMEILTEHLNLTVLVSDLYRQDPEGVKAHLEEFAVEAQARQTEALADWQAQLESDPQMRADLEAAAAEYAREQGWSEDEYTLPPDEVRVERIVEVRTVYQPYPFWVGYPWWWGYPRWYPYPWWYDWGFYYGPVGSMVVWGMPTYSFWHWYYRRPYRHYYYPHLTNGCVVYYQNHRRTGVALNGPTREFIARSQGVAGNDWLDQDEGRVNRIRDYGKLERDFANQTVSADRAKTRTELLRESPKRYPTLQIPPAGAPDPDRSPSRPGTIIRPDIPAQERPAVKPADRPAISPTERPVTRPDVRPAAQPDVRPAPQKPEQAPASGPSKRPSRSSQPAVAPPRTIERPAVRPSTPTTSPQDLHKGTWTRPTPSRTSTPTRTPSVTPRSPRGSEAAPRVSPSAPRSSSSAPRVSPSAPRSSSSAPRVSPSAPSRSAASSPASRPSSAGRGAAPR